ncbi:MAG: hypothetical protein GF418_13300, partial [Chitinivibrionales bacterium]|nr:hypothetical protein [Chitinivibrionales bacterium]MBD3396595.1 hypothetical protein [Chitinivibrionales bacterium]
MRHCRRCIRDPGPGPVPGTAADNPIARYAQPGSLAVLSNLGPSARLRSSRHRRAQPRLHTHYILINGNHRAMTDTPFSSALHPDSDRFAAEGLAFDEIVMQALSLCDDLPGSRQYAHYRNQIAELSERLAGGKLHLAVLGQFNRGKSTFLNALLGMPVLPVSVLPVTSVPTVIVHGPRLTCTVEFENGREPCRNEESIDDISTTLRRYVAEQDNPQNRRGVSRVTVTCDSPILAHGTALIDTPGFGSTHLHNTKTTRALVAGCDAALFLLSADLPITQVEVEFLKEVKRHVPRIFFVFNKIDTLSERDVAETGDYVRGVLMRELQFTEDLYLFPISAREALHAAGQTGEDSRWRDSGMESIKTGVVDFMLREKYFALSEALGDKLRSALEGILNLLREERAVALAPVEKLRAEASSAHAYADAVRDRIDDLLERIAREEGRAREDLEDLVASGK